MVYRCLMSIFNQIKHLGLSFKL